MLMGHFEKFQQQKNLQKDETIIAYADGTRKRKSKSRSDTGAVANGVLILTNSQLIFFRSGIIGTTIEKYPLNEITSTSYKTGVMSNTITVNLQNQTFDFGGNKKKIEALYEKLDNRNDLASAPADPSSAGSSDAPAERVEAAAPTPSNSPPPTKPPKRSFKKKLLIIFGGIFLFFTIIGIIGSCLDQKAIKKVIKSCTPLVEQDSTLEKPLSCLYDAFADTQSLGRIRKLAHENFNSENKEDIRKIINNYFYRKSTEEVKELKELKNAEEAERVKKIIEEKCTPLIGQGSTLEAPLSCLYNAFATAESLGRIKELAYENFNSENKDDIKIVIDKYFQRKEEELKKAAEAEKLAEAERAKEAEKLAEAERIKEAFSSWDGHNIILQKYIKRNIDDPESYEHVKTSYIDLGDKKLRVFTQFRAKNRFGALVLNRAEAIVDLNTETVLVFNLK